MALGAGVVYSYPLSSPYVIWRLFGDLMGRLKRGASPSSIISPSPLKERGIKGVRLINNFLQGGMDMVLLLLYNQVVGSV